MFNPSFRPELLGAANAFLEYLCLKPEESLLITTDTRVDLSLVQALTAAAMASGGRPSVLFIPQLPYQGKMADPYLPAPLASAAAACDVWIDLTYPYIAGSELHAKVMEEGKVRYMLASDLDGAGLERLCGNGVLEEVLSDSEKFNARTAGRAGSTVRITTPLGTDVSYKLAASKSRHLRRATEPGMYTIPGACGIYPEVESVVGRIVLETVFHEFYTTLHRPLVINIDGRIQSVEGSGPDRDLLERALLRAGGGEFGYVIHFTHGVHPAARLRGNCFVEDIRAKGCNAVGLGLPWWVPGGGENHPDAVISAQSVWLDGELLVDRGHATSHA